MKKGKVVIDYDARRIGFKNETRLVGKANRYTTIEYEDIVINAAKAAAVPESSIEMSMEALFDAMTYFVLNGHSVQIPNLGTFSLAISCKTSQNESDFKQNFAENLRRVYIRFLPDVGLKEMIASTRVETQCGESAIYNPDAVVAITSCVMSDGSRHYPLIEGRSYPVSPVTNITFNGTRLSKAYLGAQPVTLTYLKDDGTEVTALLPTTAVNMRYSQLIVSFYKVKELIPSAFAIKAIEVKDVNDVTILSKTFGNIPQTAYISAISVDEKPVAPGDTVKYTAGMVAKMKLIGFKFNLVASVEIGGQEIETKEIGVDRIQLDYAPLTTGNTPVQLTDGESAIGDPYNMSFGDVASVVVTAVTANGDPLVNGGVTSITAGNSYPLQVTGTGLDMLEAEDFVVPEGQTGSFYADARCNYKGTLTGKGTFNVYATSVRGYFQGNWSNFEGTVTANTYSTDKYDDNFFFDNSYGLPKATLKVNSGVTFDNNGKSMSIGSVTGTGTLGGSGTYTIGGNNSNMSVNFTSSAPIVKVGEGIMMVNTAGKLKSTVTVKEGALHFDNGETTALFGGALTVEGTGVVVGSGLVSSMTLKNGAQLTPRSLFLEDTFGGIFPGTVKSSAAMNFQQGSTLNIIIQGTTTDEYSRLTPRFLTMNGTVKVTLADGYTPKVGDTFTLWSASGTFSGTPVYDLPALPEGLFWNTSLLADKEGVLSITDDASAGVGQLSADAVVSCEVYTITGIRLGTFQARRSAVYGQVKKLGVVAGTYIVKMNAGLNTKTETIVIR